MYKRHVIFWHLVKPLVAVFMFLKLGYTCKKAKNLPEKYIVLSNHVTDYDPIMVGLSFPRHMYFVASEHIARWKLAYRFLNYWLAPIMRYKGTTATVTVMEMLRKVRAGHNVCMFAEGARSWDGVTASFLPSTGKVIKSAKCALVTYRIEGGYFASPNWSTSNTRRGRVYGAPVRVYTKEEIASMSVAEINEAIARDLHEDAYERQQKNPVRYKGKNLAEKMENLLFICPECGKIDTIRSQGDKVYCKECKADFRYTEYGMLEGGRFTTVRDMAKWQQEEVEKAAEAGACYIAESGTLSTIANHEETRVSEGKICLDGDKISCGDVSIPLDQIQDLTMHGRRAIVFSTKDEYYELLPSAEANVLKFHLLYDAYKRK